MPESEPEKKIVPAGTPDSSGADKRNSEPDKKTSGSSAAPKKKQPIPRRAKWAIALLILLCLLLLGALVELAFLPHFLEQDINKILQPLAEGGGVEFRIKTISLTSAEVACKVKDTTRDGRPLNVGSIGSLSIRYSPLELMRNRAIESIEIENCNIMADYSDGSFSIPAYDLFAKSFQSGEKKEKEDSAPVDDLNAVIPVKVGKISLSGSLAAVARGEDAIDNVHIPYAVMVTPDAEQGWNRLECSLMIHFSTNGIRCKAAYLHKEKKVELNLDDFSLATSAMPGTVRGALPRGLRAGVSFRSKAELDLNTLKVSDNSSVEGAFTVAYRTPQGLRINSETPFSVKMLPDEVVELTVGTLKGEYDAIPFEVGDIKANVSLPKRTVKGGFQVKLAESEPAEFSIGGGMEDDSLSFKLVIENKPLFKAKYMGADVTFRFDELGAELEKDDGKMNASASFSLQEFQADIDGSALNPELKSLTASLKPKAIKGNFTMDELKKEASLGVYGGDVSAKYKDMTVSFKPEDETSIASQMFSAVFQMDDEVKVFSAELARGELNCEKEGMKVSFKPESFKAGATLSEGLDKVSAELAGGKLLAELDGMTCKADTLSFDAKSEDGKTYRADGKITAFQFKQDAANLTYDAPELGLNAAFDVGGGVLSGALSCPDSKLAMPELKLLAQNLHWDFPFDYALAEAKENEDDAEKAAPAAPRTGRISLGDFEFNGAQAASLDGTVQWDDAAKTFRLKTDAKLFSIDGQIYANVALGGGAGVEVECGLTVPEQQADLSKDLAKFLPQFEEISCTGKLSADAVYKILPKTTTGHAKFRIADADLFIPEQKLEVRGIGLGFEVPEISILKSAPGQTLSFKSVKYDRIETGAGLATFRMEAPDTWQVENARLDWCNGHIRLGGITYRIGQTTTEAVLYCDRLEMPVFLTQIGLGEISGSGSINGTIPVVLVQKTDAFGKSKIDNIYFEDAFLFSTPGEEGVIKGDLDEALMEAGTGIEMELAKDALKDFSYSWVRMRLESVGPEKENMKLSLSLDGKPNRALYYAFDENTASFMKSNTPCIFQGIRLDTNVNMYGKAMELADYFQKIFSKAE